jgi:hypothetical protein
VPVAGWRIEVGIPNHIDRRSLLLTTPQMLHPEQMHDFAEAIGRSKKWPYRALNDLRAVSDQSTLAFDNLLAAVLGRPSAEGSPLPPVSVTQHSSLGDLAVLWAFRVPDARPDETVMVLAADSETILADRVADLVQPELWSQMKGDLVAWRRADQAPFTIQVAEHYEVGPRNPWLLLRLSVSTNPLYWLLGVLATALAGAAFSLLLLRQRKKHLDEGKR